MADPDENPFKDPPIADHPYPETDSHSDMESDEPFHTTPLVTSKIEAEKTDPTFMQNSITIQRSPSSVKEQASALSRKLSVKSNDSSDHGQSNITGVLSSIPQGDEGTERGRAQTDSTSSIAEGTTNVSLTKSPSSISSKSNKSVVSLKALGPYPLGSLRVHSPSPTRSPYKYDCLKPGHVFVIRDIPLGSIFGYDTKSFAVGKGFVFEGVKNIPPGPHFFWGGSSSTSLRNGFWIMSPKIASDQYGEILVRRWDKQSGILQEYVIFHCLLG